MPRNSISSGSLAEIDKIKVKLTGCQLHAGGHISAEPTVVSWIPYMRSYRAARSGS